VEATEGKSIPQEICLGAARCACLVALAPVEEVTALVQRVDLSQSALAPGTMPFGRMGVTNLLLASLLLEVVFLYAVCPSSTQASWWHSGALALRTLYSACSRMAGRVEFDVVLEGPLRSVSMCVWSQGAKANHFPKGANKAVYVDR